VPPSGRGHSAYPVLVSGETDLSALVAGLEPRLRPGRYVYCATQHLPDGVRPVVLVREEEGLTLVLEQAEADRWGMAYDFVAAMVTLEVHSALEAVGLTAAVSTALTGAGISCNVVAGYFHDHLFVPADAGEQAVRVLRDLAAGAQA
jgi:uncharacterized protein